VRSAVLISASSARERGQMSRPYSGGSVLVPLTDHESCGVDLRNGTAHNQGYQRSGPPGGRFGDDGQANRGRPAPVALRDPRTWSPSSTRSALHQGENSSNDSTAMINVEVVSEQLEARRCTGLDIPPRRSSPRTS